MRVAAIIPTWNRRDLIATLLANLKQQTRPFDEVLVVDNGSEDDSASVAEDAGARVIRLDRNLGFAPAVNRGIEAADCDWIAILNNDITLAPDWLEVLLGSAQAENAWFAAGKILSAGDRSQVDATFDEISRGGCAWRCGSGRPDSALWNTPRRIRIAPMTAALFRRELFEQVGLLDPSFQSYMEDVDFGIRCALAERSGVYVPAATACHLGSATVGRWHRDTTRLIARNQVLLVRKHFHGQPRWPIVAGQLLWGVTAFRHGRLLAYLRGKLQGLLSHPAVNEQKQSTEAVTSVLEASERQILELQRQTGADLYWRAYFWLARR
jgi:hypothetical protein